MYAADRMISISPFSPNIGDGGLRSRNNVQVPPSTPLPSSVIANFCVPLTVNIPLKYVDKALLFQKLGSVVQELQLSSACRSTCQSHVLTYSNGHVKRLCRLLDFIFSFGVKNVSSSFWPLAKEFACRGQVEIILETWRPKSNRSRALSWLYQCLNDGIMEFQLQIFSRNISTVRKFYAKNAYMWEVETLETVAIFLRGLENVTFQLFSIHQANEIDLSTSSIISECCAEHERVLSSSKSTTPTTPSLFTTSTSVVMVSPSRRFAGQRCLSMSSSCDVTAAPAPSFEVPVADFSECPHALGVTATVQDLMLQDTDLSEDAMEFQFPPLNLGGIRATNVFVRKKHKRSSPKPALLSPKPPVLRTVVDSRETNQEQDQCSSLGSSLDTSIVRQQRRVNKQDGFNEDIEDPDTMLEAILARKKDIQTELVSPPMSSTPIDTMASVRLEKPLVRSEPDGSESKDGSRSKDGSKSKDDSTVNARTTQLQMSSTLPDRLTNGPAGSTHSLVENGLISVKRNGLPIDSIRNDGNDVQPGSSLPDRLSSSALREPNPEEERPMSSDFEKKIFRHFRAVSDLVAGYSDSISEHSGGSGKQSNVQNEPKDTTVVSPTNAVDDAEPTCGEVLLQSREIVELSVHTFTNDGEKFLKIYRVYVHHHFGNATVRYLMLTSYAIYVLNTPSSRDQNNDGNLNGHNRGSRFVTEVVVPYQVIDYISVGACSQLFYVFSVQKKQPMAVICTCNESLTDAILSRVEYTLHRLSSGWTEENSSVSLPSQGTVAAGVVTNATPQMVALKKWLCGELGKEDIEMARYGLVYWNPNAAKLDQQREESVNGEIVPSRSGYLYVRESMDYFSTSWIWKTNEWKQSYFMLKGKKLYQFEDSTCKVGQRVFDLKDEVSGCRQIQTKEYIYCMEMLFTGDENSKFHLACQTKHDLQQWLYAFVASFSKSDEVDCECVSCCAVLAGKYLILGQESSNLGFIRTLAVVRLNDVVSSSWCQRHFSLLLEFSSKTEYVHQRWLVSFSCETEMKRFLDAAASIEPDFPSLELSVPCASDTPVCAESSRHWCVESINGE